MLRSCASGISPSRRAPAAARGSEPRRRPTSRGAQGWDDGERFGARTVVVLRSEADLGGLTRVPAWRPGQ
ncbi:MAG TPA: hypothetical protein VHW23_45695 [Kofleriaceae bacterium]|nr:hypothetical protein [Kofleriaceae bacterium]